MYPPFNGKFGNISFIRKTCKECLASTQKIFSNPFPEIQGPARANSFTPTSRWLTVTAHLLFVKSYHRAIDGC